MSCNQSPLITCFKQEKDRNFSVPICEYFYREKDNNYFFTKIIDYIKFSKCIDCITLYIQYCDLSYEEMKKNDFSVWFEAIKEHRIDVLVKLLEYGCERYSEYIDNKRRDSYSALIESFIEYEYQPVLASKRIVDIFELFIDAGIPVYYREHIEKSFDVLHHFTPRAIDCVGAILDLKEKYGLFEYEEVTE